MSVVRGLFDVQCSQDLDLLRLDSGDALHRGTVVDTYSMTLDTAQVSQRRFRRECAARALQALAHDAIQDQRYETDAGMRLDPLGQPMGSVRISVCEAIGLFSVTVRRPLAVLPVPAR